MSRCSRGCGVLIEEGDRHDVCLKCLGVQHAEAAFVDSSCPHCRQMVMEMLRSRVAVFSREPATTSHASRAVTRMAKAIPSTKASGEGDMGVSASVNPSAKCSRTTRTPSRSPHHFLADGTTPSASSFTYSDTMRDEDEMSIAASESELLASDSDDSLQLPPKGGRAQEEADFEMSAMLSRAAVCIKLECTPVPLPQRSRMETWFLGSERDSKPRPTPVPFFPEVHEELTKMWNAPFSARTCQTSSIALSSLDGGAAKGYVDVPQVERAVAVHLCSQAVSTWRGRPKLPSKACRTSASLVSKAYAAAGKAASSLHAMAILQVHQAKALKEIHEGKTNPGLTQELRCVTSLPSRAVPSDVSSCWFPPW
ncbi:uncharacterized protein LOC130564123 isoform X1 [Triplophysa rosa]|uniref:uncharacterized protein LOC130564123 isoform X1 n=1 Tax=Triplophysa rosa TaxID=992332 RepID=UPI002545CD0B|nr:uncharacterized protein LOC130564123 isoform X1 [Triplophysa rosa]